VNETEWRRDVIRLARTGGWAHYYTHYSPFSTPGWPDLALVKPPTLILAELKTDRGRVKPEQADTAYLLGRCEEVLYRLWRPDDLDDVTAALALGQGRLL